jgi:hypothetical protein
MMIGGNEYMDNTELVVRKFIETVKNEYHDLLDIDYIYDNETDMYSIWHDNREMQCSDADFAAFIVKYFREMFIDRKICNVSFSCDFEKAESR